METKLSVKACLSYGWRTWKSRPWFFIGAFLLVMLISIAIAGPRQSLVKEATGATSALFAFVYAILSIAASFVIKMGEYRFALKAHNEPAKVTLHDLIAFHPFWKYVGVSLLLLIILIPAYILLIVPGIILTLMFLFAGLIVMDKGMGPVEALKESARITKGNRGALLLLLLAIIGINLLGLIALIVGLLVSIPVTLFALVHAYRTLSNAHAASPFPEAAAPAPTIAPAA